jgi:hypothetical protein
MRARHFLCEDVMDKTLDAKTFGEMMGRFLTICIKTLHLKSLPKIVLEKEITVTGDQPTFGMYVNGENTLYVALHNRHPIDILRTMAHELTHWKQDCNHELNDESGKTGSPEENEAHKYAGIIMRNFSKAYPEYMRLRPMT